MKIKNYLFGAWIIIFASVVFAISLTQLQIFGREYSEKMAVQSHKIENQQQKLVYWQIATILNSTEENNLQTGIQADKAGYNKISEYYYKKVRSDEGLYRLGLNLLEAKKYRKSEEVLLKIKDKHPETKLALIQDYLYQAEFNKAKEMCKEAKGGGNFCATAFAATGNIHEAQGLNAGNVLAGILSLQNESSRVINLYLYLKTQVNPQSALIYLSDNKDKVTNNRDGNLLLANESFNQKNYKDAIKYLEQAKQIDPYYPQVYEHLIECYGKLGNQNKVAEYGRTLSSITWN